MEANGPVPIYLTLNQNVYGVFGSLVVISDKRQMPIKKGELRADELTFEVHDSADRVVTFPIKLSDMKMTGEASVQGQVSRIWPSLPLRGGGLGGFVQIRGEVTAAFRHLRMCTNRNRITPKRPVLRSYRGTVVLSVEIAPTGMATTLKCCGPWFLTR